MVPNTANNKLWWVNSQWAKWELKKREAVWRTGTQLAGIRSKRKRKKEYLTVPSQHPQACAETIWPVSFYSSYSTLHFVIILCQWLKKKQDWSLARWMCKFWLETFGTELHCKVIIPILPLESSVSGRKAKGSLSKMSDSCFDNLGWTLMATQIEQVWKCHIFSPLHVHYLLH